MTGSILYTIAFIQLSYHNAMSLQKRNPNYEKKVRLSKKQLRCLKSDVNRDAWTDIRDFRRVEILVFFAQVIILVLYLVLCRMYVSLKRLANSRESLEDLKMRDPFYALLTTSKSDFFQDENQIMRITTLFLFCFVTTSFFMLREAFDSRNPTSPILYIGTESTVVLIVWLCFVWRGTDYQSLFRRCNKLIMLLFVLLNLAQVIIVVVQGTTKPFQHRSHGRHEGSHLNLTFLFFMIRGHNFFAILIYFYFGLVKKYQKSAAIIPEI